MKAKGNHCPKAQVGMFVGYQDRQTIGWKIYRPAFNDFVITIHAQFENDKYNKVYDALFNTEATSNSNTILPYQQLRDKEVSNLKPVPEPFTSRSTIKGASMVPTSCSSVPVPRFSDPALRSSASASRSSDSASCIDVPVSNSSVWTSRLRSTTKSPDPIVRDTQCNDYNLSSIPESSGNHGRFWGTRRGKNDDSYAR
jgi:hypothetical protein